MLKFDTSVRAYLTADKDGAAVYIDVDGKPLQSGQKPVLCFHDVYSGSKFAKVCDQMPSSDDPDSQAKKTAIQKRNPVRYTSDEQDVNGWYVEVDEYLGEDPAVLKAWGVHQEQPQAQ